MAVVPEKLSATPTNVSVTASAVELLPANPTRVGLLIANDGTSAVYVCFGAANATTSLYTFKLNAGAVYEAADHLFRGRISAVSASGSNSVFVTEW